MLIPLNITGETYESNSPPLSRQITRNLYPEIQETDSSKSKFVLMPFPGLKLFSTATGVDRGILAHVGTLYKVTGTTLYSVNVSGTHTALGTVPGSGRCIIEPIGSNLVIVTGGRVFYYASAISEVLDTDLEQPSSAAHLNNQILYDGTGGRFVSSDVGDATSINGLNYAAAESAPDNLTRIYTFEQLAYMMGDDTIEPWFNSGIGKPPFDRVQGGILQIGLLGLHTVSNNKQAMYWLGSDHHVYRMVGGQGVSITPFPIAEAIRKLGTLETATAVGFCFTYNGQEFYQINFDSCSFCYSERSQRWFDVGEEGARHYANGYANIFGKHLVSDYRNGNIYEIDTDTFTANDDTITRVRDTGPLHSGMMGAPGKEFELDRFELIMQVGNGAITGQGVEPVVMLSVSNDGYTWSEEMWGEVGRLGEYLYKVEWGPLGAFESCRFRARMSDPVYWAIYSAAADVSLGI